MANFARAKFTALVAENTDNKATREAIFDLLEFAQKNAFKVRGGQNHKTFHYVVSTKGGSAMLFYCDSYGGVEVALGNFIHLRSADVSRFVRKLHAVSPAFDYLLGFEDKRVKGGLQGFPVQETLVDPIIMKAFKEAVLELQSKIDLA